MNLNFTNTAGTICSGGGGGGGGGSGRRRDLIYLIFCGCWLFASLTVMEAAHFFEVTEKLLEVWFSRQQPDANQGSGDLRTIPRWVLGALAHSRVWGTVAAWEAPA